MLVSCTGGSSLINSEFARCCSWWKFADVCLRVSFETWSLFAELIKSVYNTAYCSCVFREHCGTRVLCVKDDTSVLCGRLGGKLHDGHVLSESSELPFMIEPVPRSEQPSLLQKPVS